MIYEILSRGFACEITMKKCISTTNVAPKQAWKHFGVGYLKN